MLLLTAAIEDSLRMLAPTHNKLSSVESVRVMAVATDTYKKLEKVLALPYLAEWIDRYSVSLGDEIVKLLKEYRSLSDQYTLLYHTLWEDGVNPAQVLLDTAQVHSSQLAPINMSDKQLFAQTQLKLKNVTKNIVRLLNQSPVMEGILNEFRSTRPTKTHNLLSSLSDFNDVVNEKLLTTSTDEKRRTNHVEVTKQRQAETQAIIKQLEQDLAETKDKRDQEVLNSCYTNILFIFFKP